MKQDKINKIAKKIFQEIEKDLRGRSGIWECQIDEETLNEIRETNEESIKKILEKHLKDS